MRFVLDNCYLEFAINRDPKKYGGATHGINYLEFASTDIVKTRDNAVQQGFETTVWCLLTDMRIMGRKRVRHTLNVWR